MNVKTEEVKKEPEPEPIKEMKPLPISIDKRMKILSKISEGLSDNYFCCHSNHCVHWLSNYCLYCHGNYYDIKMSV